MYLNRTVSLIYGILKNFNNKSASIIKEHSHCTVSLEELISPEKQKSQSTELQICRIIHTDVKFMSDNFPTDDV
jgi:hypothetical protein